MSEARRPVCFIGLDLAWSARNPTGACALDDSGQIIDERMLGSSDEIIEWISGLVDGPAVVAVDAPLNVPNETGRRPCESELSSEYGSRKAGPHSSNRRRLLAMHGEIRGETLVERLGALGFEDPWAEADRTVLEVYPHPAIVEAFGLEERLKYKKGAVSERREGLRQLSQIVALLADSQPALVGDPVAVLEEDRGAALKAIEDRLDARLCAWIASVWGKDPDRIRFFGDAETGHIAVPVGLFVPAPVSVWSSQPRRLRATSTRQPPLKPSRQLREILSWRIAVGMLRTHPKLKLIEAHPGGGQYDCLALLSAESSGPDKSLYLNRDGSATVFGSDGQPDGIDYWQTVWSEAAAAESMRPIIERLCRMLELPDVHKLPPSTDEVIAFRAASALLEAVGLSSEQWQIRMGYVDSSGVVCDPIPHDLYRPFPHMTERLRKEEPADFLGQPGYRFWFVMKDEKPMLAFERNGVFENRAGVTVDAPAAYRSNGRELWPILTEIAADLLP